MALKIGKASSGRTELRLEVTRKGEGGSGRVGWSGPARQEVRKVTPEPVSPHGDFPGNCEAALAANYRARKQLCAGRGFVSSLLTLETTHERGYLTPLRIRSISRATIPALRLLIVDRGFGLAFPCNLVKSSR